MRKIFFAVCLLLFFCNVNAQESKFQLGIEGGPNVSQYQKYPPNPPPSAGFTASYAPLHSFCAGLTGQYNLSKIISLKSGLIYDEKGLITSLTFTYNNGANTQTSKYSGKTDYLILPIMGKFSFGKKVKFFINAGPYLGLRLSSNKVDLSQFGISAIDLYHQFDFGYCFGIGVEKEIGKDLCISLEARDNDGLISTVNGDENASYDKNISYDFLIGLRYKLSCKK